MSMACYPHTRLFIGPSTSIDISGPHIHLIDSPTGTILHSTTTFPDPEKQALVTSGPIRCAAVDKDFRFLVTSAEDKLLNVWSLDGARLTLASERELPKKPTALAFTNDANTILVSDKFGDVFSYPLTYTPPTQNQKDKEKEKKEQTKDPLSSHENPSGGTLVLGHASPLNAFLLTQNEKYIITADRDEHIRVSWFPKGYVIEMYCLGHLKFVSAIHIPPSDPTSLISGGGDPVLKVWDWMTGKVKRDIDILDVVEKFMVVKAAPKKRRGLAPWEGEAGSGRGRRKKGKGKGKAQEQEQEQEKVEVEVKESEEADGMEVDGAVEGEGEGGDVKEGASVGEEKVLVVHRIESVESEDKIPYIVFSAVGTTALFAFPYQIEGDVDIRSFDFGRPVVDFSVVDGKAVLVSLDGGWVSEKDEETTSKNVRLVRISGGEIVEELETLSALTTALNTTMLVPATAEEIQKSDIYGGLTSMPKHSSEGMEGEGEGDARGEGPVWPMGAPELSSSETAKGKSGKGQELSKKEQGRMKTKQAVLAKVQSQEKEEEEPTGKRTRLDRGLFVLDK